MSLLKEWEVARDIIGKGDERIDGLRKYGFTFVTGLLTANALVLHGLSSAKDGDPAGRALPWIGVVVSVVASVLIIAMRLLEKSTQLLQTAVAQRARVIERHIGLELCDIIAERHEAERWWRAVSLLYGTFVLVVAVIGLVAGGFEGPMVLRATILSATAVTSWIALWRISTLEVLYRRNQNDDWSIERQQCSQGEAIRIMYVRFGGGKWPYMEDEILWGVRQRTDGSHQESEALHFFYYRAEANDSGPEDCKVWEWNTASVPPGYYDIVITAQPKGTKAAPAKKKSMTLRRRVRVLARVEPMSTGAPTVWPRGDSR